MSSELEISVYFVLVGGSRAEQGLSSEDETKQRKGIIRSPASGEDYRIFLEFYN